MPLGMLPDITVTVIPDVANGRYLPFTGRDNLTVTRSSIVAIVLSAIGGAIIVRSRHFQPDDDSSQAHPDAARRICLFLLLLGLYAGALNLLGFVVASMLALVGSLLLAGERRATIIIPVAALLPVVLYLFFYKIANIPIPLGIAAPLLEGL